MSGGINMKTIKFISDAINKSGDTKTVFNMSVMDDNTITPLTGTSVRANVANSTGLVLTLALPAPVNNIVSVDFKTTTLSQLPPDKYFLELEVTDSTGRVATYPSNGGVEFIISQNLKTTTGELIPTVTFDSILKSVDDKIKVYQQTIVKGDTGETGATGPAGQNGKDSDVMQSKDNVFTGNNTFSQPINGKFSNKILSSGTDLYTILEPGFNYISQNVATTSTLKNVPNGVKLAFGMMAYDVSGYTNNSWAGTKLVLTESSTGNTFFAILFRDDKNVITVQQTWKKIPIDATLVHNTGNETVAGDKTFSGKTSLLSDTVIRSGNYGLRVTSSGIQKTSDNGTTWANI